MFLRRPPSLLPLPITQRRNSPTGQPWCTPSDYRTLTNAQFACGIVPSRHFTNEKGIAAGNVRDPSTP